MSKTAWNNYSKYQTREYKSFLQELLEYFKNLFWDEISVDKTANPNGKDPADYLAKCPGGEKLLKTKEMSDAVKDNLETINTLINKDEITEEDYKEIEKCDKEVQSKLPEINSNLNEFLDKTPLKADSKRYQFFDNMNNKCNRLEYEGKLLSDKFEAASMVDTAIGNVVVKDDELDASIKKLQDEINGIDAEINKVNEEKKKAVADRTKASDEYKKTDKYKEYLDKTALVGKMFTAYREALSKDKEYADDLKELKDAQMQNTVLAISTRQKAIDATHEESLRKFDLNDKQEMNENYDSISQRLKELGNKELSDMFDKIRNNKFASSMDVPAFRNDVLKFKDKLVDATYGADKSDKLTMLGNSVVNSLNSIDNIIGKAFDEPQKKLFAKFTDVKNYNAEDQMSLMASSMKLTAAQNKLVSRGNNLTFTVDGKDYKYSDILAQQAGIMGFQASEAKENRFASYNNSISEMNQKVNKLTLDKEQAQIKLSNLFIQQERQLKAKTEDAKKSVINGEKHTQMVDSFKKNAETTINNMSRMVNKLKEMPEAASIEGFKQVYDLVESVKNKAADKNSNYFESKQFNADMLKLDQTGRDFVFKVNPDPKTENERIMNETCGNIVNLSNNLLYDKTRTRTAETAIYEMQTSCRDLSEKMAQQKEKKAAEKSEEKKSELVNLSILEDEENMESGRSIHKGNDTIRRTMTADAVHMKKDAGIGMN